MVSNAPGFGRPQLQALNFEKETDECQQEEKSRRGAKWESRIGIGAPE
jgi:hypothetical protein